MAYIEKKGNLFNSNAMAIVNTVNCVGAMGKGIALDFKLRYPEMFKEYQKICFKHILKPGQILPYTKSTPIILNFAIKDDWKDPSRVEWIEQTLQKFVDNYHSMGITSVAFPWMGAMNGGLPFETIQSLTRKYLLGLNDIEIELKMCERYLRQAEEKNDMEAIRQIEITQRNLERQRQRIKYKMHVIYNQRTPDVKSKDD